MEKRVDHRVSFEAQTLQDCPGDGKYVLST